MKTYPLNLTLRRNLQGTALRQIAWHESKGGDRHSDVRENKRMASGKATGEFSLKVVTSPRSAGSVLSQVNWEGTGTGFAAVFNTVTYV
jgi:hypothetical protein